jgi:hypothetical protein
VVVQGVGQVIPGQPRPDRDLGVALGLEEGRALWGKLVGNEDSH